MTTEVNCRNWTMWQIIIITEHKKIDNLLIFLKRVKNNLKKKQRMCTTLSHYQVANREKNNLQNLNHTNFYLGNLLFFLYRIDKEIK